MDGGAPRERDCRVSRGPGDFAHFYRRWWSFVHSAAGEVLERPADCEDVAQQVFFHLWERGHWRSIEHPRPYLRAAARRAALDLLRARRRRPEVRLVKSAASRLTNRSLAPDEAVEQREWLDWLAERISRLPPQCRTVCTLVFLGDHSHADVAARLEISSKAVEKQVARGRRHLREAVPRRRAG